MYVVVLAVVCCCHLASDGPAIQRNAVHLLEGMNQKGSQEKRNVHQWAWLVIYPSQALNENYHSIETSLAYYADAATAA